MKGAQPITEEKQSTAKSPMTGSIPAGSIDSQMSKVLHAEASLPDVEHHFLSLRTAPAQQAAISLLSQIQFPQQSDAANDPSGA